MDLGDFFKATGRAKPVNPKPVTFTAICKDDVLPGGAPNPGGRPVRATIDACLVYCTAVEIDESRSAARAALRARHVDKKTKLPLPYDQVDINVEELYQQLRLAVRTYKSGAAGDLLFPDAETARSLVSIAEADRLMRAYEKYVKAEHPEVVDDETFREAEKAGG